MTEFVLLFDDLDKLLDFWCNNTLIPHCNLDGTFEDFPRQSLHLFWKGSTEQDGLAIWANVTDNLHYLWLESHIELPVRFVENNIRHTLQIQHPPTICRKQINHPTQCTHHNLCSRFELRDLFFDRRSTIHTRRS